jgi:hypothetical protein
MWHLRLPQRRVGGDPLHHGCNSLTIKSTIVIQEFIPVKQRNSSPAFRWLHAGRGTLTDHVRAQGRNETGREYLVYIFLCWPKHGGPGSFLSLEIGLALMWELYLFSLLEGIRNGGRHRIGSRPDSGANSPPSPKKYMPNARGKNSTGFSLCFPRPVTALCAIIGRLAWHN